MIFTLLMLALCAQAFALDKAEFEQYKKDHPEEFSGKEEGDMVNPGFRNAYTGIRKWPGGVVPYDLSEMSSGAQSKIRQALNELQTRVGPCIRFKPRTTERSYVKVRSLAGCYSYVGTLGGAQTLSLKESGCLGTGTIQHEFIHALGFMHEQCRSDRDKYLTIHYENIEQSKQHNFKKLNSNNQGLPYVYESVMQYGKYAFSKNGKPSMTPKQAGATIGIRRLHKRDVKMIQLFYGCPAGSGSDGSEFCKDKKEKRSCDYWKSLNYCNSGNYVSFMRENCAKTCGTC